MRYGETLHDPNIVLAAGNAGDQALAVRRYAKSRHPARTSEPHFRRQFHNRANAPGLPVERAQLATVAIAAHQVQQRAIGRPASAALVSCSEAARLFSIWRYDPDAIVGVKDPLPTGRPRGVF